MITSHSRDTVQTSTVQYSTVQRIEFPHTRVTYGLLSFAVIFLFLIAEALKLELCRFVAPALISERSAVHK